MSEIEIFISYAPEDEALKQELEKHLAILRHKNLITVWHNRNISAGTEWEKTIHTHLDTSSIILLLISSDFLASHYCYGVEMKYAMEKQRRGEARVIPVILRPVDWHIDPLNALQALPTDAKPVTLWSDRDAAFRDIETGVLKAVEEFSQKSSTKVPKSPNHSSTKPFPLAHSSVWSIDLKRWIALVIGLLVCTYLTYAEPDFDSNLFTFYPPDRTFSVVVVYVVYVVASLFLGAMYGPLVGFLGVGLGSLFGWVLLLVTDAYGHTFVHISIKVWTLYSFSSFYAFYRSYLLLAIAAFITGLAFFKVQEQYGHTRHIVWATGMGCLGLLIAEATTYLLGAISNFTIATDYLLEETIVKLILCLLFLPLALIISHRITQLASLKKK